MTSPAIPQAIVPNFDESNTTSRNVTLPAFVEGDTIWVVGAGDGTSENYQISGGEGSWTQRVYSENTLGNDFTQFAWSKVMTAADEASPPTVTVTQNSPGEMTTIKAIVVDGDYSVTIPTPVQGNDTTDMDAPASGALSAGDYLAIVACSWFPNAATVAAAPTGWDYREELTDNGASGRPGTVVVSQQFTGTSVDPPPVVLTQDTNVDYNAVLIVLGPGPAGANTGDVAADSQAAEVAAAGTRRSTGDAGLDSQAAVTTITGHRLIDGDLAMQAGAHSIEISGQSGVSGSVPMQAQAAELDIDGIRRSVDVGAGFGLDSEPASMTISGHRRITGAIEASANPAQLNAAGPRRIAASAPMQSQAAIFAVSGLRNVIGSMLVSAANASLQGVGVRRTLGGIAAGSDPAATNIDGAQAIPGDVGMIMQPAVLAIEGEGEGVISGSLAASALASVTDVSGIVRHLGDAAAVSGPIAFGLDTTVRRIGDLTAASEIAGLSVSGSFLQDITGSIGAVSEPASLAMTGIKRMPATIDMTSAAANFLALQSAPVPNPDQGFVVPRKRRGYRVQ